MYDLRPLRAQPGPGVVLVLPMYRERDHFSGYLMDDLLYARLWQEVRFRVETMLTPHLPDRIGRSEGTVRLHRLVEKVRGIGATAIVEYGGREHFVFPRRYVEFPAGLYALDSLVVRREAEMKTQPLETFEERAQFVPALGGETDEERLFVAVRDTLEEAYRGMLDEEARQATRRLLRQHWRRIVRTEPPEIPLMETTEGDAASEDAV